MKPKSKHLFFQCRNCDCPVCIHKPVELSEREKEKRRNEMSESKKKRKIERKKEEKKERKKEQ